MELFGKIITSIIIILILITPLTLVFFNFKHFNTIKFYRSCFISIFISFVLIILIYVWDDFYKDFRLRLMGFDFDGESDEYRARNVAPSLKETATNLYWSNMGIGWTLKAIFLMVIDTAYSIFIIGVFKVIEHSKAFKE